MPCSLLLALGLLTAPECYSSLAEHAALQWNPQPKPIVMLGQLSPETREEPRPETFRKAVPAVAEKPKPAESMTVETKPEVCTNEMSAIAERAPRKPQPEPKKVKIASAAIAQKSDQVQAPVTEVAPMNLSPIVLDSSHSIDPAPAIAERLEKKADAEPNPDEWQQIAQAWPTLPSDVRSEILRLVQNAE